MKQLELVLRPEEAAGENEWKKIALKQSGIPEKEVSAIIPVRRSIDARSKHVCIRLLVSLYTQGEQIPTDESPFHPQIITYAEPVVIVGSGPAGLFAALELIMNGVKPVILERGKTVRDRRRDLAMLNRQGEVNPDSNYCFGEGGAGTYSDGKLYTRSGKRGDIHKILRTLVQFGAPADITIDSHPHIGTNKLPGIIEQIRNVIIDCGGEIRFNHRFTGLERNGNRVSGVKCAEVNGSGKEITIPCRAVILATGHSARDIFEYLQRESITIEAKPFALGVRVEHPQEVIDKIQYHCNTRHPLLPPSPYSLTMQSSGRGVYSFCMCPGGIIAPAATSPGELVVNGWSPSKRNNPFANSGIVVSLHDNDFRIYEKHGALKAMLFQQTVEQKAFEAGGGKLVAPAQRLTDFLNNKSSASLPSCSYLPGITSSSMDDIFPRFISEALRDGFNHFGKKMRGYITSEAVVVATESRTSSPVRIPRDHETLMHPDVEGLFPCGEGAGYAGGIMSAAMDGERVAGQCAVFIQNSNRT